jgi:hypothetical protein
VSLALVFQSQWSFPLPAIRLCCQFYSSSPKPIATAVAALGRPRIHFNFLSDFCDRQSPNSTSKPSVRRQILALRSSVNCISTSLLPDKRLLRLLWISQTWRRARPCVSVTRLDRSPTALRSPQFNLTPHKRLSKDLRDQDLPSPIPGVFKKRAGTPAFTLSPTFPPRICKDV